MTQLIFNEDSYLKEAEATIVSAADNIIKLNRTVFFPEGGGQPGDQGEIILKDRVLKVIDTKKDLQENEILHYVEGNIDESIIKINEAIILSMTKEERLNPKIISGSRKKRISSGSGADTGTINKLLKQFKMMTNMMKKMSKQDSKGGIPSEIFNQLK